MIEISHEDYIRLYKELVDRINDKEKVVERMTKYIAKHANKTNAMCQRSSIHECTDERCLDCIREYFERWI